MNIRSYLGTARRDPPAWMPSEPSVEEAAVIALRERVPDYDARVAQGDVRFLSPHEFYLTNGRIDIDAIIATWAEWDAEVRDQGRVGLRVSGDVSWLQPTDRPIFAKYERRLQEFMRARRILTLCTYPLASVDASNALDSARAHHSVIARRRGTWQILEETTLSTTKAELEKNNAALEARVRERTNELVAANAALSRTEMYLEQAQSLSHTGSCGWDPRTGEYTYWSKETFRVFGLEPRSTPPPRQEVLATIHPKDRTRFHEAIAAMTREGRAGEVEFRVTRPDGSIRYIHELARPIKDDEGRVVEFIASEMDVTELKRAAARLARATRLSHERTLQARFSATLDERTRLAREIHDSLLQGATGIALHLRAVLHKLDDAPPSTRDEIARIVS
jgi:PAS domain S-box-containing protein